MVTRNATVAAERKLGFVPSKAEEMQMAASLYQTTALPVESIAAQFGVSRQTVHSWLKDLGVPQRGAMGARKKPPGVDTEGLTLHSELAVMRTEHDELRRNQEKFIAEIQRMSETMSRIEGILTTLLTVMTQSK